MLYDERYFRTRKDAEKRENTTTSEIDFVRECDIYQQIYEITDGQIETLAYGQIIENKDVRQYSIYDKKNGEEISMRNLIKEIYGHESQRTISETYYDENKVLLFSEYVKKEYKNYSSREFEKGVIEKKIDTTKDIAVKYSFVLGDYLVDLILPELFTKVKETENIIPKAIPRMILSNNGIVLAFPDTIYVYRENNQSTCKIHKLEVTKKSKIDSKSENENIIYPFLIDVESINEVKAEDHNGGNIVIYSNDNEQNCFVYEWI
jgi:hypothetical protein